MFFSRKEAAVSSKYSADSRDRRPCLSLGKTLHRVRDEHNWHRCFKALTPEKSVACGIGLEVIWLLPHHHRVDKSRRMMEMNVFIY